MEKLVSTYKSALACEEVEEIEHHHLVDLLSMQHLYISNASTEPQTTYQVVKVSGNITVSF